MRTLASLQTGDTPIILKVHGRGALSRRLADMGLVPGQEVNLVRVAPMGDPLDIRLMGYHLSLRRAEACQVEIQGLDA